MRVAIGVLGAINSSFSTLPESVGSVLITWRVSIMLSHHPGSRAQTRS